ncbi:PGF-pre-PGF domain-containing protein [Methanovulcanius yangii]|uniref:PGF-pre-PGF domain-containing protein n=1 Tax=Methanovulcanius yangii TaxID=1789227 RepID=UPI0029CA31BE|nr:PGF-pre-PGF domain-containing protein [Methanovulcanius yangii]
MTKRYGLRVAAAILLLAAVLLVLPAAAGTTPPAGPLLLSFDSPNSSGTYAPGDVLEINATYDEALAPGSTIDILLNNSVPLTLDRLASQVGPRHKGSIVNGEGGALLDNAQGVFVAGDYAYVASYVNGALEIVDISDPARPVHKGNLSLGFGPKSVYVSGNYAYVANYNQYSLQIVDITNPAVPMLVSFFGFPSNPWDVFVAGNNAYVGISVGGMDGKLWIVNITNPINPTTTGIFEDPVWLPSPVDVFVAGDYAYVASKDYHALKIIDVTDPAHPIRAGSITNGEGGALLENPEGVFVSGTYAYVASTGSDSLAIIDISTPAAPVHVASITSPDMDGARSVFVDGNYAYVAGYLSDALTIIDVSTPASPVQVASISNQGMDGAFSVFVDGGFAYVPCYMSDALEIISTRSSTLSGTYTVGPGEETPLLTVGSITAHDAESLDGTRTNTSTALPATNLADTVALSIEGPVTAAFTAAPITGTAPLTVAFTDASGGTPDCWNWSFGDGVWFNTTDAGAANPTHTYTDPGTYTVNLTVVGGINNNDTLSRAGYITVSAPPTPTPVRSGTGGGANTDVGIGLATDLKRNDTASFAMDKGAVYRVECAAGTTIDKVMVTVRKASSLPSSVNGTGTDVYEFEQVTLYYAGEADLSARTIFFRVPQAWLASNGYDSGDIVLMHYNEETGTWDELPTEYTGEDGNYYLYRAETPSFSWFAIGVTQGAADVAGDVADTDAVTTVEEAAVPPSSPASTPTANAMTTPVATVSPDAAEPAGPTATQSPSSMPVLAALAVGPIGAGAIIRMRKDR